MSVRSRNVLAGGRRGPPQTYTGMSLALARHHPIFSNFRQLPIRPRNDVFRVPRRDNVVVLKP